MAAVFQVQRPIAGIYVPTVILWRNQSLGARGPAGLNRGTLIHDLRQATVAKPEMRFTAEERLHGGVRCTV